MNSCSEINFKTINLNFLNTEKKGCMQKLIHMIVIESMRNSLIVKKINETTENGTKVEFIKNTDIECIKYLYVFDEYINKYNSLFNENMETYKKMYG